MENGFFSAWSEASLTTLGYFWKAFWAFVLGYVISGMIQVFVTRERREWIGAAPSRRKGNPNRGDGRRAEAAPPDRAL